MWRPPKIRWQASLVTGGLLVLGIGIALYHQLLGLPDWVIDHTLYATQVISGNWSPDPKGVSGWIFLIGSVIAVILNLITVTGILSAARDLYFIKRSREMEKMAELAVFELRSADQKDRLIELLDDDTAEKLAGVIDQAFEEGGQIWKEKTVPRVLGETAAQKFLASVEGSREERNNPKAADPSGASSPTRSRTPEP